MMYTFMPYYFDRAYTRDRLRENVPFHAQHKFHLQRYIVALVIHPVKSNSYIVSI